MAASTDRQVPSILVAVFALILLTFLPLGAMWIDRLGLLSLAQFGVFVVYFLVAHVYLPYWVYVDVRDRGGESSRASAWAAATFLVPVVVFVVYVVLTRR